MMASSTLLPSTHGSAHRLPPQDSSQTRSSQDAQGAGVSPQPHILRLTRVQTVKQGLLQRNFSAQAAESISRKYRSSTCKLYEVYWSHFLHWCEYVGLENPLCVSVQQLSDFLLYLIDRGKHSPETLETIKSCVCVTLKLTVGLDFSHSPELAAIMQKYHRECPRKLFTPPDWNLVYVLEMLIKPPFEPLGQASLKHLTYETVFLVAMSCA